MLNEVVLPADMDLDTLNGKSSLEIANDDEKEHLSRGDCFEFCVKDGDKVTNNNCL